MSLISVIVPVYKAEPYFDRCIQSILNQTFTDFELILVDDGSPDGCPEICDEYAKRDSRVIVIHQSNQGQAAARNAAIAIARGQWVHFVDADDVIHPQMLELLYKAVQETNAKIAICSVVERETESGWDSNLSAITFSVDEVDEMCLKRLLRDGQHCYWIVCAKMIDISIVKKIPFTNGRVYEDNAVVPKWLHAAGVIAITDNRLYFYRINKAGTTKSDFSEKQLDFLWALEQQMIFCKDVCYNALFSEICKIYLYTAIGYYLKLKNELQRTTSARKVRKVTRKNIRKYRIQSVVSQSEWRYYLTAMYPRRMEIYWMFQAIKRKIGL